MAKPRHWHSAEEDSETMRRQAADALADGASQRGYITYDAYLDMVDEDTLAEWVAGTIIMTSPASQRHQDVGGFLFTTLFAFVGVHTLGKVLAAPFQMKLPRSGREPNVIYVATAHLDRFTPTYLAGPADLVVEIVSPESAHRDRVIKFEEYQDAGIPEYWLLDPDQEQVEFYRLTAAGWYDRVAVGPDGVYRSEIVPGFWLRLVWLWQQPLPDTVQVLLEIDRAAYAHYLQEQLRQAGL